MSNGVSVDSAAVQAGIKCCDTSIRELEKASQDLNKGDQQAGDNGWRDSKYERLGEIVNECRDALEKPVGELNQCKEKLKALLEAIINYEQNKL